MVSTDNASVGGQVGRVGPFGSLKPRKRYTLRPEQLAPVVRLVHQVHSPVNVPERIIVDHELVLLREGDWRVTINGTTHQRVGGSLLWLQPFVPHHIQSVGSGEHVHIAVHFDLAPDVPVAGRGLTRRQPYAVRLPGMFHFASPGVFDIERGGTTERLLIELLRQWDGGSELGRVAARGLLLQIIVRLCQRDQTDAVAGSATDAVNRRRMARAVAWLRANLHRQITVSDLADAATLSESHLSRLFRQYIGQPPKQYLLQLRIERARMLLAQPDLSIKQIGHQCGFGDAFHFSRAFRRIDGLSPSEYRESAMTGPAT